MQVSVFILVYMQLFRFNLDFVILSQKGHFKADYGLLVLLIVKGRAVSYCCLHLRPYVTGEYLSHWHPYHIF